MPYPAQQNFSSANIKIVTIRHTESRADNRDKQKQHSSKKVLVFSYQEILTKMHSVNILFTKFTFLFTILVLLTEIYQSNFAEPIFYRANLDTIYDEDQMHRWKMDS